MDEEIRSYNWNEILANLDTEDSFTVLHDVVVRAFNTYMPEKTKRLGYKKVRNEPLITNGIKTSIAKQKKLYKMTIHGKCNPQPLEKYKAYRNMLQRIKRHAKTHYYRSRCKKFKNDSRKLWNLINNITCKVNKKETIIESMKVNNIKVTN